MPDRRGQSDLETPPRHGRLGCRGTACASYEQQLVNANQQALAAAVHRYRTAYQNEVRNLTKLLRTAKAIPFPGRKLAQAGTRPSSSTGP